ncbi:hypothetical protein IW261DRAFT_1558874 [Armillaria novae-zelandiae]|uniref:Uncharacterized protein n=1 Tax=Armillaria novae-zelandiae TaxID=153914 RepID=A0AA39PNY7_9AGAR|nr:hypothetical protein IW261DRAFT_1558874 [Armillaria novae-zelandiae]
MPVTASSLRRAWLPPLIGVHRMPLNVTLTHFAGAVTCLEDIQRVMDLPALIECQLIQDNGLSTGSPPLRNDHIQRFSTDTPDILQHLTLPSLKELRIFCECQSKLLIPFFTRSSCNLTRLHIAHSSLEEALILSEYQATLEKLIIDAGWTDIGIIDSYPNLYQLTIRLAENYRSPPQDEIKKITTHLRNRTRKKGNDRRVTSLRISCPGRRSIHQGFDYVRALRMNGLDALESGGLQVAVYQEARTWLNSKLSVHELC